MTAHDIGQILRELGVISARQEEMGRDIKEVKVEVKKTNGRVSALEKERHDATVVDAERKRIAHVKSETRQRWGGYFQPVITGVMMVVLAAVIVALLNVDKL